MTKRTATVVNKTKRKADSVCQKPGHICPNPECTNRNNNKPYQSLSGLNRHFLHRPECQAYLTTHLKVTNNSKQSSKTQTQPNNTTGTNVAHCVPINTHLEVLMDMPDAEDYETGYYSEDDADAFYTNDDYLIIPEDEIIFTNEMRVETSLLKLCIDMDAPLWAFQQFMEWARDAFLSGYNFLPQQSQYESQVRQLQKWLNMEHMRPTQETVLLPGKHVGRHEIKVTSFNFKSQVHSLLSDSMLNKTENLVINPESPFSQYVPPDGKLSECLSGSWYRDAWSHMEAQQLGNFLCPVILYIDKTHLSITGKLTLFPVMMSLGIFTAATRRHSYAWRPLGFIANESVNFSKDQRSENDADTKNERFHTILKSILQSFKNAQVPGALRNLNLQLGEHVKRCDLYMPLQFIIGDVEGGDMLCSRYHYRMLKCNRLCRTCDVSTVDAGRTDIDCNRICVQDIKNLIAGEKYEELHSLAQRPTFNALYDMDCGNDPYGVFSMIHTEGLHAIEIGLIPYMIEILLKEISPQKNISELDELVQRLCKDPNQHAYDNFPRALWPDGVTSLTMLSGSEKVGKMFAITLVAQTLEGMEYFCRVLPGGELTWKKMLYCFQQILCYWSWLKQDTFWQADDVKGCEKATRCIKIMMKQIQVLWPRKDGLEWNLTKLHEQFHIPFDIFRHGAHINVHTGPQEHNHIQLKRAAKNTQRRKAIIDFQTGERVIDRLIIDKAFDICNSHMKKSENDNQVLMNGISPVSSKGKVILIHRTNQARNQMEACFNWENLNYNSHPIPHSTHILVLLHRLFFATHSTPITDVTEVPGRYLEIQFFSEYRREGVSYRCHPHYRSQKSHYDWSYVRWHDELNPGAHHDVIGRILLFYMHPIENTIYAIIHSVDKSTQTAHGVYGHYYYTEQQGKSITSPPSVYSVSVECLEQHALMVRYKENDDNIWVHIWDQADWVHCFQSIEDIVGSKK